VQNTDISKALKFLEVADPKGYGEILDLIDKIDKADGVAKARNNFLDFVKLMWPGFIAGKHHVTMAKVFEDFAAGKRSRCTIAMPPRHTKSEFGSYLFPAWFIGKYPDRKIIQASSTAELAAHFGSKVRNLVATEDYQRIFPGVELRVDSKARGRWMTTQGGEYFAIGAGGALAGRGGDLVILDDVVSEQEALASMGNPEVYDKVYEWYVTGPRQRLQPGGRILQIATRWAKNDLTGRLQKEQAKAEADGLRKGHYDEWETIELPAILPSGIPLWPEYWKIEQLEATRNSMPVSRWMAQYQQSPTSDAGALIKREWWKRWEFRKPPNCSITMLSGDLAYTAKETSNYSAFTLWGIFPAPIPDRKDPEIVHAGHHIILLDAWRERMEFPELKKAVFAYYGEKKPDMFLMENKAAGISLIQELRSMGIPVMATTPAKGTKFASNDKIARVNAITDIFASGMVWAPESYFADMVIEECAEFPLGEYDDYVDTVSQAMTRFRQGGFIRLQSDEFDDGPLKRRVAAYY
jgi:predicted phage terminase large subunit-like protein